MKILDRINLSIFRFILFFTLLLSINGLSQKIETTHQLFSDQVKELLRHRIETSGNPPKISVGEEIIHSSLMLPLFYEQRTFIPAWIGANGPLPHVNDFLHAVHNANEHGMRPNDYHFQKIESILEEINKNRKQKSPLNPGRSVDLDLLLTDSFLVYASHLLAGRVNPQTFDPEWHANRREMHLVRLLEKSLEENNIQKSLESLLPFYVGYHDLKQTFMKYQKIAAQGGWPTIQASYSIKKDDMGERVERLRERLIITDNLKSETVSDPTIFDESLEQAVYKFQQRHGLAVDGIVGPDTLAALNVPIEQRISQIELNLERWRWLPQNLGENYILVNIANFELDVIEESHTIMTMRAVVGKTYRRTPVFSDKITYLVINPSWLIPPSIAVQDILPQIKKDPEYLSRQNIKVLIGWGADAKEIDPKNINWTALSPKEFPYRFIQEPGPLNSLGKIKFMFPNKFNVYLHDTPAKDLFGKSSREFSSGCIRIEKPLELAEYVLREDTKWTKEAILIAVKKGTEQTIRLPQPIPIHLLYWTAWVDQDGTLQFRNDIYGRDTLLKKALEKEPPCFDKD